MKPVIGISVCAEHEQRQFVPTAYLQAIYDAGGTPILLPYLNDFSDFQYFHALCHGFLFCGGDDLSPLLFGEELQTDRSYTDYPFDSYQVNFMRFLLQKQVPILGICRGMQVLNVALGGTLYQDLSLFPDTHLTHMQSTSSRSEVSHKITVLPSTRLYDLLGPSTFVNSYHHQGIHQLGANLLAAAHSSDGLIEAIECKSNTFVLGVQWHPECLYPSNLAMRNIFISFVASTQKGQG